ncbi:MAG: TolC family protein [Chlamydiales bacterium]|nr:TolC family protein [Chlamydiales bacterium]
MFYLRTGVIFGLLVLCGGCDYYMPNPPCPPPPSARPPITPTFSCTNFTVPPLVPDSCEMLALADLVDLGLQNSPTTRAAWYHAKQAAAHVGSARGAYLPTLELDGVWEKNQFLTTSFGIEEIAEEKIMRATLTSTYLLWDFGGRNGNLMAARAALDSLNWIYNWEVQTVMIYVIQSYYNYANALEIVAASEKTVQDNLTTVEAAKARVQTGVNALSDQLQAETSLVQSQIELEQNRGILNVAYATLVQSLGLPPDTPLCIAPLPEMIETKEICENMETLMQLAKENRADLNAMRASVLENRFEIRVARSALMPTVKSMVTGGYESINGQRFLPTYGVTLDLNVPLFKQFKDINNLRSAQAALLQAQAELDNDELTAFLAVVSDYYELIANTKILKYSYSYLEIATKNREVAFANYKMGVTTIIDLMTANNALNIARQQLADAKTNFLSSIANLSYATGGLTVADFFGYFANQENLYENSIAPFDN